MAQSNRGRELRAAAALKRFETQEKETKLPKKDEDGETSDETDYVWSMDEEEDEKTIDVGGGKFLVPVSREQDGKSEQGEMQRELLELVRACGKDGSGGPSGSEKDGKQQIPGDHRRQRSNQSGTTNTAVVIVIESDDESDEETVGYDPRSRTSTESSVAQSTSKPIKEESRIAPSNINPRNSSNISNPVEISADNTNARELACSACSVVNECDAILCMVCANVLEPGKMPNAWRCSGLTCDGSTYRNAGDVGICGICGQRKSA